jgi:hypothetical protein
VHVDVKIRSKTYIQILGEKISILKTEYDYNICRKNHKHRFKVYVALFVAWRDKNGMSANLLHHGHVS